MSSMFKKKVGNVYTDDPLADFLAACAVLAIGGFILFAVFAG